MEDLPLGIIAALVSEFAVKDLPFGRTLMMMIVEHLPQRRFIAYHIFTSFFFSETSASAMFNGYTELFQCGQLLQLHKIQLTIRNK